MLASSRRFSAGRARARTSNCSMSSATRDPQPSSASQVSPEFSPNRQSAKWPHTQTAPSFSRFLTPVSCSEAHPEDLLNWTEGRALIGTGSPFGPVSFDEKIVPIPQTNNSYIFPGLALGIIASKARRVTDTMIMAAAKELARLSSHPNGQARLPASVACRLTPTQPHDCASRRQAGDSGWTGTN